MKSKGKLLGWHTEQVAGRHSFKMIQNWGSYVKRTRRVLKDFRNLFRKDLMFLGKDYVFLARREQTLRFMAIRSDVINRMLTHYF